MQQLIEDIAKALVDAQDQVTVTATENGPVTAFSLRVAQTDLGRVIGKQGRTARSLRTILAAAATKNNQRATLEIVE